MTTEYKPLDQVLDKLGLDPAVSAWAAANGLCYLVSEKDVHLKGPSGTKKLNVAPLGMQLLEAGKLGAFSLEQLQQTFTVAINGMMATDILGAAEKTKDAESMAEAKASAPPETNPLEGAVFGFKTPAKKSTVKKKTPKPLKKKSLGGSTVEDILATTSDEAVDEAAVFASANVAEHADLLDKLKKTAKPKLKTEESAPEWVAPVKVAKLAGGPVDHVLGTSDNVKLALATKMYQPTDGTSGGSKYFCIAADQDLRVGVRWNSNTLSVRIEGDLVGRASDIAAAGISVKDGYASDHIKCSNPVETHRVMGAILMALNLNSDWPLPKLALLANKGA